MCPLCLGSALLALTGASSAGGLVLIAARLVGSGGAARRVDGSGNTEPLTDYRPPAAGARAGDAESTLQ
jgi:hypothetical protein